MKYFDNLSEVIRLGNQKLIRLSKNKHGDFLIPVNNINHALYEPRGKAFKRLKKIEFNNNIMKIFHKFLTKMENDRIRMLSGSVPSMHNQPILIDKTREDGIPYPDYLKSFSKGGVARGEFYTLSSRSSSGKSKFSGCIPDFIIIDDKI